MHAPRPFSNAVTPNRRGHMTADEYTPHRPKFFVVLHIPDGLFLDGTNSSQKPLSIDELRAIFRQETLLLPNGMDLADLTFLKREHDLNPRYQYTYDPRNLRLDRMDHVVVIRLGKTLQAWDYTGFVTPALEPDPCMMLSVRSV